MQFNSIYIKQYLAFKPVELSTNELWEMLKQIDNNHDIYYSEEKINDIEKLRALFIDELCLRARRALKYIVSSYTMNSALVEFIKTFGKFYLQKELDQEPILMFSDERRDFETYTILNQDLDMILQSKTTE